MRDTAAFEQIPVAGQYNTLFGCRDKGDFFVFEVRFVQGVEATHAQQTCKPAEVYVGNKTDHAQGSVTHTQQRSNVQRFKFRVNGDSVAFV